MKKLILLLGLILLAGCTTYDYEVCDSKGKCPRFQINKIIQPSLETQKMCSPNWKESGAKQECEQVPTNQLLLKTGTDKKYCDGHGLSSDFVDNWWNSEGLIDQCEMPVNSNMQFIFKQHDQSIRSHNGVIQVRINIIDYENENKALQIFTGTDENNDNLPDEWIYCGNVDNIKDYSTKYILCSGDKLKFIKLVNAPWNKGSLFIDEVEVLKV